MSKEETRDLKKFLKPFPAAVNELALWLRDFVWDLYPKANELIYDNYNALAFGWSPTDKVGDTFCNVAVGRSTKQVLFGFYWGSKIADPEKRLLGEGNQFRYIRVPDKKSFPKEYVKKLMRDAYAYSASKMKPIPGTPEGATILKSVVAKKRAAPSKKTAKKAIKKPAPKRPAKKKK